MSGSAENLLALLFEAAIELPAPERTAFLNNACGSNADLRAELQRLVDAHDEAGNFLLHNPKATRPLPNGPAHTQDNTDLVGTEIGPYRLLELLGEGGWGMVFVAEQRVPVRRRIALKLIKPGMDSKALIARFESERQAIALMDHPNIAKFLDAGTTPLGHPYFVMELVRGTCITDFCDQVRLSTRERLDLFVEVCRAVQHAHQKGVIHRDLKPSNILVTLHDGKPVPKIIDFGIAKATQGSLTEATVYTQLHQLIGTPAYMSPEQAEMTSLDIDTRTDIYSLGVLLYELLTGHPPFDPKELTSIGLDAMRRTIREKEPPRPSTRLSTLLRAELWQLAFRRSAEPPKLVQLIRGDLDWIVMRCIEKDRNRRYETANGLASDIVRHLNHEPVEARPPSSRYWVKKAIQRNLGFFTACGVVFLVMVLGTSVSIWQALRASHERDNARRLQKQAEAAAQMAKDEAVRGNAEAAFIKSMFLNMIPLISQGDDPKMLLGLINATMPKIDAQLSPYLEVKADLRHLIGKLLILLGNYPNGEEQLREALSERDTYHAPEDLDEADIRLSLGTAARETQRLDIAEKEYGCALRIRRNLLGNTNEWVAQVLGELGIAIGRKPGPASNPLIYLHQEEELLREALEIEERAAKDPRIKNILLGEAARNKSDLGQWEASLQFLSEALSNQIIFPATNHSLFVATMAGKAGTLAQCGRFDEALEAYREVIDDITQRLGSDHENVGFYKMHLANVLDLLGKCAEAEPLRRDSLKHCVALAPPDATDHCLFHARLGRTLLFEGKMAEAEAEFREDLRLREKSGDLRSLGTLNTLHRIGSVLLAEGHLVDAEMVFHDMLIRYWSNAPPLERQIECQYLGLWADTLWQQGKFETVERAIAEAMPKTDADSKLDDVYAYVLRADFRARAHKWELARQDLERAVTLDPKNILPRHRLTALYLQHGQLDLMKQLVNEGVTILRGTYDSQTAAQICIDYALLPANPVDERIDKLVTTAGRDGFLPYWTETRIDWFDLYPLARGLVHYRQGKFESASEWAEKAAAIPSLEPNRQAQGLILQAMAQHRLGHSTEAHTLLNRAESLMKAKAPTLDSSDLGDHWADVILTHNLLGEARQLLKGQPGAQPLPK